MRQYVPAGALLHPLALMALGLLVVNDHWWKDQFGSVWTGKLSDVAGLILFPLVIQGMVECIAAVMRQPWRPSFALIWTASVLTGAVFAALQLSDTAGAVCIGLYGDSSAVLGLCRCAADCRSPYA